MIYIGIDPGLSGGLAALDEDGRYQDAVYMPGTERDILDWLATYAAPVPAFAMLERVGVMPKQGIVSAFTFGKGVGALEMALVAAGIPFDRVVPAKWQQLLDCRTGGNKNISKRRAQQLFPGVAVTHALADALLLAEYCRRIHRGSLWNGETNGKEGSTETAGKEIALQGGRRGGKTHAREVSAAEARTAVSGASRPRAGARRPAR